MGRKSYTTERKIRIIKEKFGPHWAEFKTESIDTIYNEIIGDKRINLFAKVNPQIKKQAIEMSKKYDITLAKFLEHLIKKEYEIFEINEQQQVNNVINEFSILDKP